MPFARLTISPALPPKATQGLLADLTGLIAADLGKRHDLTSVFLEVPAGGWAIGAAEQTQAAHLEVCVTAGTNTAEEKRAFIAHAMQSLRREMPLLPLATYVVVRELPATDWGYDGQTQADRAVAR